MSGSSVNPTLAFYGDKLTTTEGAALAGATVIVLKGTVGGPDAVNTSTQPGSPLAAIYYDPYGEYPIDQETGPLVTDGQGNFEFWAQSSYYVLQIYGNGIYQVIDGQVEEQYIQGIGTGIPTAPGGSNGQIQFNDDGVFGGLGAATGYGTPTGNALTPSFSASTITLEELAAEVAQLIIDLKAAGLLGS